MFEELKKMNAELEELQKAHLEKSKVLFTDVSKKLFEKHPALESYSWRQYTPYFNDGDECVFSARTDYPTINGEDPDDSDAFDEITVINYGEWDRKTSTYIGRIEEPNPNYKPELSAALKDVKEFLSNIKDEVLRQLFGDHVEVTVCKDKTEVEEYEHD